MMGWTFSYCSARPALVANDVIILLQSLFVSLMPSFPKTAISVVVTITLVVGSSFCSLHCMVSVPFSHLIWPSNLSLPFCTVLRTQSVRRLDHRRKDTVLEHAQKRVRRESLVKAPSHRVFPVIKD